MRALVLEPREDWTTFEIERGFQPWQRERYGLSICPTRIPVIGLASWSWSVRPSLSSTWPWVQGKNLTGGMYSPSAGRIIPFHQPEKWYQIALPVYAVVPLHPERVRPPRAINLEVPA